MKKTTEVGGKIEKNMCYDCSKVNHCPVISMAQFDKDDMFAIACASYEPKGLIKWAVMKISRKLYYKLFD